MPADANLHPAASPPPSLRRAPEPELDGRVSANALYLLHKCERRLWLRTHAPTLAAPPSDFDRLIWEKGREHEQAVRDRFGDVAGPIFHGQRVEDAAAETARLLAETRATLYQPLFLARDGTRVGVPDFVFREDGGLVVHDAKLAVNLDEHREIALQMAHYAHLVEDALGTPAARLEITNGKLEVIEVPALDGDGYEHAVARAAELISGRAEPTLIKSHSTCAECPFYDHCWPQAVAERRIEVLVDVNAKVAPLLHDLGIRTIEELAAREPHEIRIKGIAGMAEAIVAEARAHREDRAVWLAPPELPGYPLVWFDLEGDPEGEEVDKAIYLWGLAVDDGVHTPKPEAIVADGDDLGGRRAWERFVQRAQEVFARHPQARWVHYHSYEKVWVRKYLELYGAPAGFAERMEAALFDLYYKVVRKAVRLPLHSYSIKKVAQWVGFRWRNPESGSAWSIVQYQQARASRDAAERARLIGEIVSYNQDDLEAMRRVWKWFAAHGSMQR